MPLLYWEIMWRYVLPQIFRESGLKRINILDLPKMRII